MRLARSWDASSVLSWLAPQQRINHEQAAQRRKLRPTAAIAHHFRPRPRLRRHGAVGRGSAPARCSRSAHIHVGVAGAPLVALAAATTDACEHSLPADRLSLYGGIVIFFQELLLRASISSRAAQDGPQQDIYMIIFSTLQRLETERRSLRGRQARQRPRGLVNTWQPCNHRLTASHIHGQHVAALLSALE